MYLHGRNCLHLRPEAAGATTSGVGELPQPRGVFHCGDEAHLASRGKVRRAYPVAAVLRIATLLVVAALLTIRARWASPGLAARLPVSALLLIRTLLGVRTLLRMRLPVSALLLIGTRLGLAGLAVAPLRVVAVTSLSLVGTRLERACTGRTLRCEGGVNAARRQCEGTGGVGRRTCARVEGEAGGVRVHGRARSVHAKTRSEWCRGRRE